jgi:PAS domain S-box-containing protein
MSLAHEVGGPADETQDSVQEIVDSMDQILFMVAGDLSCVYYVSPAYERITGYSRESLYEHPRLWIESIVAEDSSFVREMVAKRLSGELHGQTRMEYRIRTADGTIRWLRTIVTPVSDDQGNVVRLKGLAEDITAQKEFELTLREQQSELARNVDRRATELAQTVKRLEQEIVQRKEIEAELRRSHARFRRLFEANIIGVCVADIYGNVLDANAAFLQISGYSRSDLPLRWDKMTPPEWRHTDDVAVQELIRNGSSTPYEKEYVRPDGTRVPILLGAALLDHDTWQCVAFVLDRTRHKRAEEQVREVNLQLEHAARLSLMGELVAGLAHEMHQPLGAIKNYASGCLLRFADNHITMEEIKERLEDILAESTRVAEILRTLRNFIQKRAPERKPVDLNSIVVDSLQFTRLERREHNVAISFRSNPELPLVLADRVQLTQVLVNLILNAIQASTKSDNVPRILIQTYVDEAGFAEISISDNGPGIAAADVPRIFERFFTTKVGGLGLGLPISRSIVEAHGGKLWCDSNPGDSTSFRMTLPTKTAAH